MYRDKLIPCHLCYKKFYCSKVCQVTKKSTYIHAETILKPLRVGYPKVFGFFQCRCVAQNVNTDYSIIQTFSEVKTFGLKTVRLVHNFRNVSVWHGAQSYCRENSKSQLASIGHFASEIVFNLFIVRCVLRTLACSLLDG